MAVSLKKYLFKGTTNIFNIQVIIMNFYQAETSCCDFAGMFWSVF